MKTKVKLYELPIGGKFYYEGIIWTLLDIKYDLKDPDNLSFHIKKLKSDYQMSINMSGNNVLNTLFYRFIRREPNSFIAGFKMAVDICSKNMSKTGRRKAGVEFDYGIHMKGMEIYKKWKENDTSFNCSGFI